MREGERVREKVPKSKIDRERDGERARMGIAFLIEA